MPDPVVTAAQTDITLAAGKIATGVTKEAEAGAAVASTGFAAFVDAHPNTALSVALGAMLLAFIGLVASL